MSGRVVYVPQPDTSHRCNPHAGWRKPKVGTIWRCDDCGRHWEWNWGHTPMGHIAKRSWVELPDDYAPPVSEMRWLVSLRDHFKDGYRVNDVSQTTAKGQGRINVRDPKHPRDPRDPSA